MPAFRLISAKGNEHSLPPSAFVSSCDVVKGPSSWRLFDSNLRIDFLGEGEFAVFNGEYWDSYVFNAVDACLLRLFVAVPGQALSESELNRRVAEELDVSLDDTLRRYTDESLTQMAHVGLVYREQTFADR